MNRPLPAPARDVALLLTRVVLGVVLFAHGWQKMVIDGFGRTSDQFQSMGIPLAIVTSSFVTVVEFVGGALLIAGALTTVVAGLHLSVMIGATAFVHVSNGIFAQDGGWELVGVIAACELALAGRFSIDHLVGSTRRGARSRTGRLRRRGPRPRSRPSSPPRETATGLVPTTCGRSRTGRADATRRSSAWSGLRRHVRE